MFLGPIKALYNAKFYTEYMQKSAWKAVLFLVYLFVITAAVLIGTSQYTAKPIVNNIIEKVAQYTPEIDIVDGKATVNNDQPLTIKPTELAGYNIVFDTGRTEPVYPTQMAQDKTLVLVTGHTVYFNYQDQFQVNELPDDFSMTITPQMITANQPTIASIMISTITSIIIIAQLIKLPFMLLLAFLAAMLVNSVIKSHVNPGKLLKLACYLQAPVTILFVVAMAFQITIPFVVFIYVIMFGAYSKLALNHFVQAEDKPEAEKENTEVAEEDDTEDKKEI